MYVVNIFITDFSETVRLPHKAAVIDHIADKLERIDLEFDIEIAIRPDNDFVATSDSNNQD